MTEQAEELIPSDLENFAKDYIIKNINHFTLLFGKSLYNDVTINLTAAKAMFIIQVIAEWSYHLSNDLINSGISDQYWDIVMQKTVPAIFEHLKEGLKKGLGKDKLLKSVEKVVYRTYRKSIGELGHTAIDKTNYQFNNKIDKINQTYKARLFGIILCVAIGYFKHISPTILSNINRFFSIIFILLMFTLPIVTFIWNHINFDIKILTLVKKLLIEVALIAIAICFSANLLKVLLGYQHGVIATFITCLLYSFGLLIRDNLENE